MKKKVKEKKKKKVTKNESKNKLVLRQLIYFPFEFWALNFRILKELFALAFQMKTVLANESETQIQPLKKPKILVNNVNPLLCIFMKPLAFIYLFFWLIKIKSTI